MHSLRGLMTIYTLLITLFSSSLVTVRADIITLYRQADGSLASTCTCPSTAQFAGPSQAGVAPGQGTTYAVVGAAQAQGNGSPLLNAAGPSLAPVDGSASPNGVIYNGNGLGPISISVIVNVNVNINVVTTTSNGVVLTSTVTQTVTTTSTVTNNGGAGIGGLPTSSAPFQNGTMTQTTIMTVTNYPSSTLSITNSGSGSATVGPASTASTTSSGPTTILTPSNVMSDTSTVLTPSYVVSSTTTPSVTCASNDACLNAVDMSPGMCDVFFNGPTSTVTTTLTLFASSTTTKTNTFEVDSTVIIDVLASTESTTTTTDIILLQFSTTTSTTQTSTTTTTTTTTSTSIPLAKRQITSSPLPSACANSAQYASACSCIGYGVSASRLPVSATATITVTVSNTVSEAVLSTSLTTTLKTTSTRSSTSTSIITTFTSTTSSSTLTISTTTTSSSTSVFVCPTANANRQLIVNGGFESNFNGWQLTDQAGGSGAWLIYSSDTTSNVPPPFQGNLAAYSQQGGPGSHVLYQDLALPVCSTITLSFAVTINNQGGAYATPYSLDYQTFPNQQFRVDVIDPFLQSDPFTVDTLAQLFRTEVGSPLVVNPYQVKTFDLSRFAGRRIRLRFAEVDNIGNFYVGVDAVGITY